MGKMMVHLKFLGRKTKSIYWQDASRLSKKTDVKTHGQMDRDLGMIQRACDSKRSTGIKNEMDALYIYI